MPINLVLYYLTTLAFGLTCKLLYNFIPSRATQLGWDTNFSFSFLREEKSLVRIIQSIHFLHSFILKKISLLHRVWNGKRIPARPCFCWNRSATSRAFKRWWDTSPEYQDWSMGLSRFKPITQITSYVPEHGRDIFLGDTKKSFDNN